jgi:ATP-dependent RNA helicase DHX8/PRP22
MKEVNQYNGREFSKKEVLDTQPMPLPLDSAAHRHAETGALTGIKIESEHEDDDAQNAVTDPWEASRMGYMGRVSKKTKGVMEEIEETNIEVNEK